MDVHQSQKIQVQTLGMFRVTVGGVELSNAAWHRRKARQLFKCVVTQPGRRLLKDEVVDWLWPESDGAAASTNLRTAVHAIRRALGKPEGQTAANLISFDADAICALGQDVVWIDADAFELAAAEALHTGQLEALRRACALYGGAYLPEDIYEDWSRARRDRLQRLWSDAAFKLGQEYERRGELLAATAEFQRLTESDRGDERVAHTLMRLHILQGRRTDALRVFDELERYLREELAVEPSQAVLDLRQQARAEARPPVDSLEAPAPVLPVPLTSFVGRKREVAEVQDLLHTARLVTLIGPGGVGKTRLALETARRHGGAVFVDLGSLAEAQFVTAAVAAALSIREQPNVPLLDLLTVKLASRRVLLVLDNCEHLVQACATLAAQLLHACPQLQILATSRERLDVAGEYIRLVPPLSLPDSETDPTTCEAVRLFVDRARLVQAGFTLHDGNTGTVMEICRGLDGIPLAIELATARVRTLGLDQLARRLDQRLGLLTGGSRMLPARQQTLRATIDWSYALLDHAERQLFDQLSVFAGGWTLEAAEAIAADEAAVAITVLDVLARLVDRSMVAVDSEAAGVAVRYRLLDTLRQYGREYLDRRGEAEAVRARHASFFTHLAEQAERELRGPAQRQWLDRLSPEQDNLREALSWALERGEVAIGLRLGAALSRFWRIRGHLSEGRRWLEALLALAEGAEISGILRARVLSGSGQLAFAQGSWEAAEASLDACLKLCREAGDMAGVAAALRDLGRIAQARGDYVNATSLYEQSLALCRHSGDKVGVAACLDDLGEVARHRGEYRRAAAMDEEALVLQRELGDSWGMAFSLNELANVARHQGEYVRGRIFASDALGLQRELGDLVGAGYSLNNLGIMAQATGEHDDAARLYQEALRLFQETGDRRGISVVLPGLSTIAVFRGNLEEARVLAEQALQIHRELGEDRAIAQRLDGLGRIARQDGDTQRALNLQRESLVLFARIGDQRGIAMALDGVATVAAVNGQQRRAAQLFGATSALCDAIQLAPDFGSYVDPRAREAVLAELRGCLGEEAFARSWDDGRRLPLAQAVAEALSGETLRPSLPARKRTSRQSGDPLTSREWDVVRLVTQGQTNRQIGQALVISSGTVRSHVEHILAKLAVGSRAEIAAWAVQRELT